MKHLIYMDWLRVWATIAVVTIHVAAGSVSTLDSANISSWMAGNFFDSLSRASVPIFVMISGALLLRDEKELSIVQFLKKRGSKVLIPFLGWSILFYAFGAYRGYFPASVKEGVKHFLTNGISMHLWFLYMIVGLYLITPILKIFIKNAKKRDIQYFLILWLYTSVAMKVFTHYYQISFNIELYYVTDYVGYFVLGYYLANYEIEKKWRIIAYIGGLVGFVGTFVMTYVDTVRAGGQLADFWYSYFAPNVVLMAVGLFVSFKYFFANSERKLPFVFNEINRSSMGIYILHYFLMNNLLYRVFQKVNEQFHTAFALPINILITISLCMSITFVMQRIPVAKKLVP